MKELLLTKIENHTIRVGVVGLGYVGLPLAVEFAKAGFATTGLDTDPDKADQLRSGHSYIGDVTEPDLAALTASGMLCAETDFKCIEGLDFIAICVPTPLDDHQQPDIQFVRSSGECVAQYMKRETAVVLESTTYPGTTEKLLRRLLEEGSGLNCGKDFYLGYSPERVDPGNSAYKTKNTPKVVGAIGPDALEVISAMYDAVLSGGVHAVSSPAAAEMTKILENTYRNVNIGLVNELAQLCHRMEINIWEVIDAASTKPFGFQAFYPGPGLGGHCIPLDPYYLTWEARKYGFHTSMIESSMSINDNMPQYCVERCTGILNRAQKSLKGSKVLVLGIAYKQDVDDYRESPALEVICLLKHSGADVRFYDPLVKTFTYKGESMTGLPELTETALREADLVVITTAHTAVDYEFVQKHADAIFDTKNAMKHVARRSNIELL